jgi:hypothetical protein
MQLEGWDIRLGAWVVVVSWLGFWYRKGEVGDCVVEMDRYAYTECAGGSLLDVRFGEQLLPYRLAVRF